VELTFLTPMAAIFAVSALLPLAILWRRERRADQVRRELRLEPPARASLLAIAACVAAAPVLLGIAAAQPVLGTERSVPERADAQAFFVLDTSRSMLAAAGPHETVRFDRAREVALQLRDRIPQIPAGVVSMTDRLLPHVFPTTDRRVFEATIRRSIDVEVPPPAFTYSTYATGYEVLADIPERRYFAKTAKKRLLVVLTDGESRPFGSELARAFDVKPPIEVVFVRFWKPTERIYETGVSEGGYRPDPGSRATVQRAAEMVGGHSYDESEVAAAGDELVRLAGKGPTTQRTIAGARFALAPWVTLAALLPLAYLLWRRNLRPWSRTRQAVA
jgi:hypothetical protein